MKIKNEAYFENADTKLNLSKISSEEIEVISVDDVWDGPLCGKCRWENNEYYFYCFDQVTENDEDLWPRKYLLISLSDEQKKDDSNEITITEDQVVGWFDSGKLDSQPSKFIKSYFTWKENEPQSN